MDNSFVQTQVDTFNHYLRTELNAEVVVSSLRTLLHIVNTEHNTFKTDLILEIIFHPDCGLLNFLRQIKNADYVTNEIVNATFDLLDGILKDFRKAAEKYTPDIFDTCTVCIFWAKSSNTKLRSYVTTRLLVKNYISIFQEYVYKLEQLLSKLILQTDSLLPSLEKKNNYELIGVILKYYPAIVPQLTQNKLFRKLKVDLKSLLPKNKPTELEGLFRCLVSFLHSFQDIVVPGDTELYSVVKDGCNLDSYRRISIRVAFKVVRNNFDLFTDNVYNDCEWWYNKLQTFLRSPTKEDYTIAFDVLNVFYEKIAKVLKDKSGENDKKILRFFINKLKEDIQSGDSNNITLAMKNLGYFAEACKLFNEIVEIEGMFALTAQLTEKYNSGTMGDSIEVHYLSDLLLSVTEIAKSYNAEDLGEDKLNVLRKLTVFVITTYPKVSSSFQIRVKQSLLTSINNVAMIGEAILDSYLDKLMFVSLIKCCSHLMQSDVEFLKKFGEIDSNELILFKNYVFLWRDICKMENIPYDSRSSNFGKIQFELRLKKVDTKLFDKFITAALNIIEKLDFSVTEEEPDDKLLMNSIEYTVKPNKESDFYIFMNLVELLSSVIRESDPDMFENWLPHLTTAFVHYATSCPIKIGFYNLLTIVFQKSGSTFNSLQHSDVRQLNSFLCHVVTHIREQKGIELISCLRMIMNSPLCSIQHISPHMISLFQIIFTLGLEDLALAEEGLNSLQNWYLLLPKENFEPVLFSVIPCFIPYMQSKKFAGDTDALTESEKKLLMPVFTQPRKKPFKIFRKACISSTNSELSKLQRKIVKFLSEIDTELCSSFYRSQDCSTFESTEILKFELPFIDMKVRIFLDKFLPRVTELACNSGDLKTRVVACEVLHSIMTVFVGNSIHLEYTFPQSAQNVFKYIVSCVFKLGADNNIVVKQLFHPLCLQLTHYYSSKLQNRSSITDAFLETLFDCISNDNDNALRHFTAEMVREFVVFSIRSARNEMDVHSSPNILAIIKRICLFCVLPSDYKRLGAALAFNRTYRILREELELVNMYWIELLFHFVKNLSLSSDGDCNNIQSSEALDHIKRVLFEKFELFTENHGFRRVPLGLKGGTLNDVLLWLFPYCVSQNKLCRSKCVELISTLVSVLPGYDSLKCYFNSLNSECKRGILNIFSNCIHLDRNILVLHGMNQKSKDEGQPIKQIIQIINWLKSLLSGYHCLYWLLKEEAISLNCLDNNTRFLDSIKNFNDFFLAVDLKTYIRTNFKVSTSDLFYTTDFDSSFKSLKQQVFFQILEILTLPNMPVELFIGEEQFQYNLWNSFVICLFEPSQFAASFLSNEIITDLVLKVLINLRRLSNEKLKFIYSKINEFPSKTLFWNSVTNLLNSMEIFDLQSRQYLNGLFILEKAEWLNYITENMAVQKEQIITNIFHSLSHNQEVVKYNSTVCLYLEDLLRFSLKNAQIDKVMNLVYSSDILVYKETNSTVTHGRQFFLMFKKPIIEYLNQHQLFLISDCLKHLYSITKQKIQIIADCLAFAAELKQKINFDDLVVGIFENWSTLVQWIVTNSNCMSCLLGIIGSSTDNYKQLTNGITQHMSVVFHWLLSRLTDQATSVLLKKQILELLPPFISEEMKEDDQNIFSIKLRNFQSQHFDPADSYHFEKPEYLLLFDSVLTLLNRSSNATVLKYVIHILASNHMNVSEENIENILINLMHKKSAEVQLKLLMVPYQIFKNENHTVEFNIHCIQFFLIPLLNLTSADSAQKFFIGEFSFILETLKIQILNYSTQEMEESIIGRQIVATLLIQSYCDVIYDFDCPEVRRAIYSNESTLLRREVVRMFLEIVSKHATLASSANESLLRRFKCYAYNTLIKIVCKVQREEKFYKMLFSKNIWENIVDNNAKIELKMFLDELPKRKKCIIQKRRDLSSHGFADASGTNSLIRSLPTQYLSTSSLAEDIVKFDMSEWNINDGSMERVGDSLYSVNLEEDILNKHECMTPLCELVKFIVQNKISLPPNPEEKEYPVAPMWMECLRESLNIYYRKQKRNTVIFILKLIYNCENIFHPYAHRWLSLIIDCLTYLNEINYFVADIIVMLLKWHSKSSNKDKSANNKLLFLLLSQIDYEKTNVRNYQLELIITVVDIWIENIDPPYNELLDLMKMKKNEQVEVSLSMSKRFLLKSVVPFTQQNKIEYISTLVSLIDCNFKRSNMLLIFQILALVLRVVEKREDIMSLNQYEGLKNKVTDSLHGLKSDTVKVKTDLFFLCLHHTLLYYDKLLLKFSSYLLSNFSKFQGEIKIKCLKIMSKDINQLPHDAFAKLMQQQFLYCLRGSDHELLKSSLLIIKSLANQIEEDELMELLPDIMRLSSHVSVDCRSLVYDISANTYLSYQNKTDERHVKIKTQCKAILLTGLLDNDSKLQENNFSFWKDKIELGKPVAIRFINIIRELYSPFNESHFVSYAADYLLDACSSTPDFESKIFDNPLGECTFEDYKIISSLRRNRSLAPMFVNSLANQLITMSQSSEFGKTSFLIRGTQNDIIFQPTVNSQGISDVNLTFPSNRLLTNSFSSRSTKDGTGAQSAVDEHNFALKKLERRLQPDAAKAAEYYASLNIKRRERRKILLSERIERRDRQINFHRNYRTGNYPDVEIPRSAIIIPLKMLAKRDPIVAKLILISVFEGVLDKIVDKKNYLQSVNNTLNEILQFSLQHDSIFIETLFEIAFNHSSDIQLDSQQVVVSSHSSGLLSLGALLLENVLCSKLTFENIHHIAKKLKVDSVLQSDTWTQLAELYKALDEKDVVNGILKEKLANNTFSQLKRGLEYEQIRNWATAYNIYYNEVKNLPKRLMHSYDEHFIFETYFNCAARLSKWTDINYVVKEKFQDLNSLWNENWDIEHTLPWLFSSEAYLCAMNNERSNYLAENGLVHFWLQDEEKKSTLTNLMAEQLSILLLLEGENNRSYCLVHDSIQTFLDNWNHSILSKDRFSKLQTLSEIETMLSIIDVRDEECFANKVNSMLASWKRNAPRKNNIIWWDKRTMYRLLFATKYAEFLNEDEDDINLKELKEFKYNSYLHVFEAAVDEKNYDIAKKYLVETAKLDDEAHFCNSNGIKSRFSLNHSKMLLLKAIKCCPSEKIGSFVECLEILEERNFVKNDMYDYHIHLGDVIFRIIEDPTLFLSQSVSKIELMSKLRIILKKFYLDDGNIFGELRDTILCMYQTAANIAEKNEYPYSKISATYVSIAKHCRQFLQLDDANPTQKENYEQNTIRSTLKAIKYNSKEAQILFPTLLQLKHIKEKPFREIFISESEEVEEWKFLPWIHQLLAHLDTDVAPVIENIVIKIASKHPGALQFSLLPYSNKIENWNSYSRTLSKKLEQILNQNLDLRELVKGLTNVRTPEAYFKNWLQKLSKLYANMKTNDVMNELYKEAVGFEKELESLSDFPYRGELLMKHGLRNSARKCTDTIQKNIMNKELIRLAISEFQKDIETEEDRLNRLEVQSREYASRKLLISYSPRLLSFADRGISDVEIPGQYDGFSCPDSNQHVKIYEFDKKVEVQCSKQKPIKITIIGSDAKKYSYLVKFEEDMRQDQRIQQIFTIMNQCGSPKFENSQKFSVMTYGVFPLTPDFGIIQWLENTIPLRDFADYGLKTEARRESENKRKSLNFKYHTSLEKEYCKHEHVPEILVYEEATKKYTESYIITSFRNISKEIPDDVFKKSLLSLCYSPTMYWSLRNQFIISYSTACIYGWILGIGDRHLKNTLVCLKTGNCIAIDFGYAFGSGIEYIPVPELIPFRITPHIQSVMAPFYLTGLIRETMINVLQTIIDHENILLSTLQIFILEPSLNWLSKTKKKMQEQNKENLIDVQWHPTNKINIVKRKLHGVNPVTILIEEVLKNEIIKEQYREACIKLLQKESRLKFENDNLNPTEQAECLLDLATDECILGLSWKGLETYI